MQMPDDRVGLTEQAARDFLEDVPKVIPYLVLMACAAVGFFVIVRSIFSAIVG